MKQLFTVLAALWFAQITSAQSGFVSMNLQETRASLNPYVYYPSVEGYYEGLFTGKVDTFIVGFNSKHVTKDGKRTPYTDKEIEKMVAENASYSLTELSKKLNSFNRDTAGGNFSITKGNIELRDKNNNAQFIWKDWLISNTKPEYLKFNLGPKDSVYLQGRYGDPATPKFGYVAYGANADGWYYVLTAPNGKKLALARIACANLVRGWRWLLNSKATIVVVDDTTIMGDDGVEPDLLLAPKNPKGPSGPKGPNGANGTGQQFLTIVDSAGNTYNIYVQAIGVGGEGGNVTIGDITAKGGNSINNNNSSATNTLPASIGKPNPNYDGGGDNTPAPVTPAPQPAVYQPYPYQPYPYQYQPFYYPQQYYPFQQFPGYGYGYANRGFNFVLNLGGGGNRGAYCAPNYNYGQNSPCFGGYGRPRPNPTPPVGNQGRPHMQNPIPANNGGGGGGNRGPHMAYPISG